MYVCVCHCYVHCSCIWTFFSLCFIEFLMVYCKIYWMFYIKDEPKDKILNTGTIKLYFVVLYCMKDTSRQLPYDVMNTQREHNCLNHKCVSVNSLLYCTKVPALVTTSSRHSNHIAVSRHKTLTDKRSTSKPVYGFDTLVVWAVWLTRTVRTACCSSSSRMDHFCLRLYYSYRWRQIWW